MSIKYNIAKHVYYYMIYHTVYDFNIYIIQNDNELVNWNFIFCYNFNVMFI